MSNQNIHKSTLDTKDNDERVNIHVNYEDRNNCEWL